VIVPDVGGSFGSKGTLAVETPLVALAALQLGRPVKWAEDRLEDMLAAPQGRGLRAAIELALDADGRILALRGRLLADLGAYFLPSTAMPPHTAAMLLTGSYDIQDVDVVVTGARTNKVPTAPYRGAGRPEATYLIETTIDAAARQLGIDPVELRRRNLVRSFPYRTALGWTYDSGDFERCLDTALSLAGTAPASTPDVLVGTGVALCVERSGGLHEHASVTRGDDGEVLVAVGSTPSGQGHQTLFAQIAADRLGIDPGRVTVRTGDTDAIAEGVGSFASRSTVMGGSAVAAAADDLLAGGDGTARFTSEQVFASGAYVAVVAVERATGQVRVLRVVAVDDAGTIVNPLLAEGQRHGGIAQGVAQALLEEVLYDEDGNPTTSTLADYPFVSATELPSFELVDMATPTPMNPLGAKGIGEAGTIGATPAVQNAVIDAVAHLGVRHVDMPTTPMKVWRAINQAGSHAQQEGN
jgi:carbon-monoxide dehydrogenase large subunit